MTHSKYICDKTLKRPRKFDDIGTGRNSTKNREIGWAFFGDMRPFPTYFPCIKKW